MYLKNADQLLTCNGQMFQTAEEGELKARPTTITVVVRSVLKCRLITYIVHGVHTDGNS